MRDMADDKRETPGNKPNPGRRRPAPTIDLSATEVKTAEQAEAPKVEADAAKDAPPPSDGNMFLKYAGLGASLAAGVVATLAVLWFATHLPSSGNSATALRDRIAALEAQVAANASRPQNDDHALADVTARLGKLEQAVSASPRSTPDPAVGEKLATIDTTLKSLGSTLATLNSRVDEMAAAVSAARDRADAAAKTADALQGRLDALEQSAKATQDKVAQASGADAVARRVLAAFALRDAVVRGVPYAAELAAVKGLDADASAVAALAPLAESGAPTDAALVQELRTLLPRLVDAAGADATKAGGFFERLQANAGKLVRIRPIGEPSGDDPSAVLARIEVKVARNDVAGIAAELVKLPAKARALTASWSRTVAARNAAVTVARKLAADSAAALGAH
jgi:hypothetical protein